MAKQQLSDFALLGQADKALVKLGFSPDSEDTWHVISEPRKTKRWVRYIGGGKLAYVSEASGKVTVMRYDPEVPTIDLRAEAPEPIGK